MVYNKLWYENNKDKRKEQMRKYWSNSKDKQKERKKIYYEKNKDYIKQKSKEYKLQHKEKYKELGRLYWLNNKDWLSKINAERNRNMWKNMTSEEKKEYWKRKLFWEKNKKIKDPQFAIKKRIRLRVWQTVKGIRKNRSDELGIDYIKIAEHLNKSIPEDYNSNSSKYEIDHIIPLCSFDLTNDDEVKKAFAPENHRWLLSEENAKKRSEDIKFIKTKS